EVVLLDVLAVIALAVGQAEESFLENRVLAVPEGQGQAETLLVVRDAGQAVLAPAVGTGTGLVVAEVIPGVARKAVILADGAPLTFAQVGTEFFPGDLLFATLLQAHLLGVHGEMVLIRILFRTLPPRPLLQEERRKQRSSPLTASGRGPGGGIAK